MKMSTFNSILDKINITSMIFATIFLFTLTCKLIDQSFTANEPQKIIEKEIEIEKEVIKEIEKTEILEEIVIQELEKIGYRKVNVIIAQNYYKISFKIRNCNLSQEFNNRNKFMEYIVKMQTYMAEKPVGMPEEVWNSITPQEIRDCSMY